MYDTCIAPRISFRTRASALYSFNDYSYYPNERHPFACSSHSWSRSCCSCCVNSVDRVPITPSYCYDSYGLRQSYLIQRSCRKLISGGYDGCFYYRFPACDFDRSCYCGNFGERAFRGRRFGFRKCMVFEGRGERCDLGGVDEAEVVLSLLTGDVGEESFHEGKKTKRLFKKSSVEKREDGKVCNECGSKKKRNDLGVHDSGTRIKYEVPTSSSRKCDNRREERIQKEEEREALSRREKLKARLQEEKREASIRKEDKTRGKLKRETLLRKESRKADENQERESLLRKENWVAHAREEEKEDFLRRANHRQRVRKDGSSCTSYYSLSSAGDYESDNEIDIRDKRVVGELSSEYVRDSKNNEMVYQGQEAKQENKRFEDYEEEHGVSLTKKSSAQRSHAGSRYVDSELRKKTEKKLTDISIEEMGNRKETSQKESELSLVHKSDFRNSSDSYLKYEGRTSQLTGSTGFVKESAQKNMDGDNKFSRQSETKLKYKHLVEIPGTERDNVRASHGSQKIFRGEDEMSAKVTSSSQEVVGENRTAVGVSSREEEYQRNSLKVMEQLQEIDIRKNLISHQTFETNVKTREDYSSKVLSLTNDSEKQERSDQASRLVESRGKSQQSTTKESTSILKKQSDSQFTKQEDNVSLAFGSSSRYQKQHSSEHAKLINKGDYRRGSDNLTNILITHATDSGGMVVEEQHKIDPELFMRPPSAQLGSDGQFTKQEDIVSLAFGSSSRYQKQHSSEHAKLINKGDYRRGSDNLTNILITHATDSGGMVVEEEHKIDPELFVRPPSSQLGATGVLTVESTGVLVSGKVSDEILHSDSTALSRRHLERSPALHHESYGDVKSNAGQPSKLISHDDEIGSAARLQEFSAHYVGEFVDKARHELLSSKIQMEKKSQETEIVLEEKQDQKSLVQYSSGVSQSRKHGTRHSNHDSSTQGPLNETWREDDPSVEETSKAEVQEDANSGNATVKRTGRSLWNVIADIVQLRWSSRSKSQSTVGMTGGRSSPNQSTSSETWFSGHEAEENEETTGEKEMRSMTQEATSGIQQHEIESHSKFEEGSSSSTFGVYLEHADINASSSSVVLGSGSSSMDISLPSIEETSKTNHGSSSSAVVTVEPSHTSPVLRLRRSPVVRLISEGGELNASDSNMSEQVSTGSVEQSEAAVTVGEVKGRKFKRNDQVIKDRFDVWEEAYRIESEQRRNDEMFMREALLEAQRAANNWEVPVGAVLVHNGKIIARGCNLVEESRDSTAHAEMICIREASNILKTWRLSATTLYVTLEPCPMCAGAILQARVDTVVWGAPNKLLGADGSWIRLFPSGDEENHVDQTDKPPAPIHPFHPKITIRRGVLASECADTMQQFFQLRRKKKNVNLEPPTPPSCLPITPHPSKFMTKIHDAFHIMFCL
ncbi:uncharacterized protein [Henckelia pumila]|uniref:uncharacterized protein n=1 Tax=Henckelia pumila TaxID=405737 RepID=UPI003C6DBDF2